MTIAACASEDRADRARWRALALICLAVVLPLSTWFSATAILPQIEAAMSLSPSATAWTANGVQIGFVVGALGSSLFNLPDLVRLNRLMAAGCALAAAANASVLLEPCAPGLVAGRIATGLALAGVYPPALKLVSTWFRRGRGLALGALIGALTIGSALPHLVRATSSALPWDGVVVVTSAAALLGGLIFLLFAREGPHPFARTVFDPAQIGLVLKDPALRLVTLGYLGHMWELYAMWAWILLFVVAAFDAQGIESPALVSLVAFAVVAFGAVGCLAAGILSDRAGRAVTAAAVMALSGACAVASGFVFSGPTWLFTAVLMVWGVTIVADSAQFSAATTELADPRYVGTALSLQLGLGFGLTTVTIWAVPQIAGHFGSWRFAFAALAVGPLVGAAVMLRVRSAFGDAAQEDVSR